MSTAYHHLLEDESFSFGGISKTDVTTYAPWNEMLNRQTQGVWVTYGRDRPASEAARGWRISIQTKTDQVIHINPFEKTEGDDIVVAVQRPATDSNNEATQSEYQEMVSTAVCLVGRAVLPHTTVGDILNTIQRSGIANYRLKDKRGLRFWVYVALEQIFIHLKNLQETIGRIVLQKIRAGTAHKGDRVIKGLVLEDKWEEEALDVLTDCSEYNEELERRFDAIGF